MTVTAFGRTWHIGEDEEVCRCVECGCKGNHECGHRPPKWAQENGMECALNRAGVCPCCAEEALCEQR